MSQTIASTVAVPAKQDRTASRTALLVLAALVAAFVALGIEYLVGRVGPAGAHQATPAIVAIVAATYAMGGAIVAAIFLPVRREDATSSR